MDMSSTTTLVPIAEYLSTSYRPDRDYVDGQVLERNLGERDHSELQGEILTYLNVRRRKLGIRAYPEQRVQVSPTRFRIPDICVVAGQAPAELILTSPPFLCIEVLSKDDRAGDTQERIDDFLAMGVRYVWVVNPRTRRGYVHTTEGSHEAKDGVLRTADPEITLPLPEIFQEIEAE